MPTGRLVRRRPVSRFLNARWGKLKVWIYLTFKICADHMGK